MESLETRKAILYAPGFLETFHGIGNEPGFGCQLERTLMCCVGLAAKPSSKILGCVIPSENVKIQMFDLSNRTLKVGI